MGQLAHVLDFSVVDHTKSFNIADVLFNAMAGAVKLIGRKMFLQFTD